MIGVGGQVDYSQAVVAWPSQPLLRRLRSRLRLRLLLLLLLEDLASKVSFVVSGLGSVGIL